MHRLRKVAEQTGIAYEDLAQAGKNAAKFTKIKSQLNFSLGNGKEGEELKEFLTNSSQLNEKGEATIKIDGSPKLVRQLTTSDLDLLKAQVLESQKMNERAK